MSIHRLPAAALAALVLTGPVAAQSAEPPPRAVPLGAAYDAQNPFARMLSGELANVPVAETQTALAFMDHAPAAVGHVLVIPKSATVSLLDSTPEQLAGVMALVRCVAIAQAAAFTPDGMMGMTLSQNNGGPNQHVAHLHFHLIPRYVVAAAPASGPVPRDQLEPAAARIRAFMPATGC